MKDADIQKSQGLCIGTHGSVTADGNSTASARAAAASWLATAHPINDKGDTNMPLSRKNKRKVGTFKILVRFKELFLEVFFARHYKLLPITHPYSFFLGYWLWVPHYRKYIEKRALYF